jgi:hypothetical protein
MGGRLGEACGVARSPTSLVGSWSKPHEGVTDPLILDALSLREGVVCAKLPGSTHVIMEIDVLRWTTSPLEHSTQ